ncbi:MAG: MinD/ParA family ATP-binding protein [Sporichthyaceae bacterium]
MLPPLLPPTGSAPTAAIVPAPTTVPEPAPATAVVQPSAHDDVCETVEMPQLAAPAETPAERIAVIPSVRPAGPSLRDRLTTARLRRPAAAPAPALLPPGAELTRVEDMRRPFRRPMTVLVANPKGGSGKTPLTLLLAGTLALMRGGHVLAWDNNEARGGLAFRANPCGVADNLTVRDLLADIATFESHQAGMGELAAYLRPQDELFDVLASDSDPASLAQIRGCDFARLHAMLRRYYRILILDSGNNVRSEAWQAAAMAADCLVLPSSYDADSVEAADWTLEHLISIGRADLVERAVTVLTAAGGRPDPAAQAEAHARFARTAAVIDIAHDPRLRSGERVGRATVAEATTAAVLRAAQAVVAQLSLVDTPSGVASSAVADDVAEAEPASTEEFEDAAAEALAIVEHSRRVVPLLPLTAPAQPLTVVPDLPADDASEDVEPTVLDLAKAAAAKVVAAQSAAPKRRTATARTTKKPAAPKADPNTPDSAVQVRLEPEKCAPTALSAQEAVPASPKNTRRIAKPRTDAPVSANPPAADVTSAPAGTLGESGEVDSTDTPFLFAPTTAAGLPASLRAGREELPTMAPRGRS